MACIALAGACSEQDAQPSNTVARQVLDGGSVSIASLTMASLDPLTVASAYDIFVIKQVCDTLVSYDRHLRLQPALAEHWTVSEDHRVHTFLLTEGALFHDGTPVTAVAVRDSLARAIRHLGKPGQIGRAHV